MLLTPRSPAGPPLLRAKSVVAPFRKPQCQQRNSHSESMGLPVVFYEFHQHKKLLTSQSESVQPLTRVIRKLADPIPNIAQERNRGRTPRKTKAASRSYRWNSLTCGFGGPIYQWWALGKLPSK